MGNKQEKSCSPEATLTQQEPTANGRSERKRSMQNAMKRHSVSLDCDSGGRLKLNDKENGRYASKAPIRKVSAAPSINTATCVTSTSKSNLINPSTNSGFPRKTSIVTFTPLPAMSKRRIQSCFKVRVEGLGASIYRRARLRRSDCMTFVCRLGDDKLKQISTEMTDYVHAVVQAVDNVDAILALSERFGETFPSLTCYGFKAEFFGVIADAVATECISLDRKGQHRSELLQAWSQLVGVMFASVRDGYYTALRNSRRESFQQGANSSCMSSSVDTTESDEKEKLSTGNLRPEKPDETVEGAANEA